MVGRIFRTQSLVCWGRMIILSPYVKTFIINLCMQSQLSSPFLLSAPGWFVGFATRRIAYFIRTTDFWILEGKSWSRQSNWFPWQPERMDLILPWIRVPRKCAYVEEGPTKPQHYDLCEGQYICWQNVRFPSRFMIVFLVFLQSLLTTQYPLWTHPREYMNALRHLLFSYCQSRECQTSIEVSDSLISLGGRNYRCWEQHFRHDPMLCSWSPAKFDHIG